MYQSPVITLKIIDDKNRFESLTEQNSLSATQRELITFVTKIAVQEYIAQMHIKDTLNYDDRILKLRDVMVITGLSRSSIYQYMKVQNFPQSIKLGQRSIGWSENQIRDWLEKRPNSQQL